MTDSGDPHRGQPALRAGADPVEARAAMIMLHGKSSAGTRSPISRRKRQNTHGIHTRSWRQLSTTSPAALPR
jgi:hypothetical protein